MLCEGKSALEVIQSNIDFDKNKQINSGNIDPILLCDTIRFANLGILGLNTMYGVKDISANTPTHFAHVHLMQALLGHFLFLKRD